MPAVVILMTSPARSLATNHGLYAKPVCAPIGLPCCCTTKPRPSPGGAPPAVFAVICRESTAAGHCRRRHTRPTRRHYGAVAIRVVAQPGNIVNVNMNINTIYTIIHLAGKRPDPTPLHSTTSSAWASNGFATSWANPGSPAHTDSARAAASRRSSMPRRRAPVAMGLTSRSSHDCRRWRRRPLRDSIERVARKRTPPHSAAATWAASRSLRNSISARR
jgi:hypothetical protein